MIRGSLKDERHLRGDVLVGMSGSDMVCLPCEIRKIKKNKPGIESAVTQRHLFLVAIPPRHIYGCTVASSDQTLVSEHRSSFSDVSESYQQSIELDLDSRD